MSHELSEMIADMSHRFLTVTRAWDILKWPAGGIGLSTLFAQAGNVAESHVVNVIALGILSVGSAAIGLWRFWMLAQIDIDEKRRESLARVPVGTRPAAPPSPAIPQPPSGDGAIPR